MTKWTINELAYAKGTSEPVRQALLAMHERLNALEQSDTGIPVTEKQVEPVAWMFEFPDKRVAPKFDSAPHGGNWVPLYTTSPQRQPLTPEERSSIVNDALRGHASTRDAIDWSIRNVERHHGIGEKP